MDTDRNNLLPVEVRALRLAQLRAERAERDTAPVRPMGPVEDDGVGETVPARRSEVA